MAQWRQRVVFYQNSDRVPVMDYLCDQSHVWSHWAQPSQASLSQCLPCCLHCGQYSPWVQARLLDILVSPLSITFALLSHLKTLKPQPDNDCPRARIRRKQFLARAVGLL
jgi:hypothetical protein